MFRKSLTLKSPFMLWLLANIIGFGVLGLVVLLFPTWISQSGFLGSILIITVPVSITQWIVLKRFVSISRLWILAFPLGLFLAVLLIRNVPDRLWAIVDDESIVVLAAGYLVVGFLIGLPQWLLLRRKFAIASLWIPGTAIGLALGSGLVLVTNIINKSGVVSYILVVLVYATVTGLILTRWIAQPGSTQTKLPDVLQYPGKFTI